MLRTLSMLRRSQSHFCLFSSPCFRVAFVLSAKLKFVCVRRIHTCICLDLFTLHTMQINKLNDKSVNLSRTHFFPQKNGQMPVVRSVDRLATTIRCRQMTIFHRFESELTWPQNGLANEV